MGLVHTARSGWGDGPGRICRGRFRPSCALRFHLDRSPGCCSTNGCCADSLSSGLNPLVPARADTVGKTAADSRARSAAYRFGFAGPTKLRIWDRLQISRVPAAHIGLAAQDSRARSVACRFGFADRARLPYSDRLHRSRATPWMTPIADYPGDVLVEPICNEPVLVATAFLDSAVAFQFDNDV